MAAEVVGRYAREGGQKGSICSQCTRLAFGRAGGQTGGYGGCGVAIRGQMAVLA